MISIETVYFLFEKPALIWIVKGYWSTIYKNIYWERIDENKFRKGVRKKIIYNTIIKISKYLFVFCIQYSCLYFINYNLVLLIKYPINHEKRIRYFYFLIRILNLDPGLVKT